MWKPAFLTHPEDIAVEEGSTATFVCAATGSPRPEITWLKDNSVVFNPYLIQNESTSVSYLVLRSVTKEQHSGTYHCEATNLAGRTTSKAGTLTVTEKPTVSKFPREGKDRFRCRFASLNPNTVALIKLRHLSWIGLLNLFFMILSINQ